MPKPEQKKSFIAKFPGGFNLDTLTNKEGWFGISVGQEYHEGEKYEATLNLICQTKIKKIYYFVADGLQHYNLQILQGLSFDDSLDLAIKKGEVWLKNHQKETTNALANKGIECEFIRWSDISKTELFKKKLTAIKELYNRYSEKYDPNEFKSLDEFNFIKKLHKTINRIAGKKRTFLYAAHKKNGTKKPFDANKAQNNCISFALEDIAMIATQSYLYPKNEFLIYPRKKSKKDQDFYDLIAIFSREGFEFYNLRFRDTYGENTSEEVLDKKTEINSTTKYPENFEQSKMEYSKSESYSYVNPGENPGKKIPFSRLQSLTLFGTTDQPSEIKSTNYFVFNDEASILIQQLLNASNMVEYLKKNKPKDFDKSKFQIIKILMDGIAQNLEVLTNTEQASPTPAIPSVQQTYSVSPPK